MSDEPLGEAPGYLRAEEKRYWGELSVWPHLRASDRPLAIRLVKLQRREAMLERLLPKARRDPEGAGVTASTVITSISAVSGQIGPLIRTLGGQPMQRVTEPPAGRSAEAKTKTERLLDAAGIG